MLSESPSIAKDDVLQRRLEATGLIDKKEKIEDKLSDEVEDLPPEKAELMLPVYKYFTFQLNKCIICKSIIFLDVMP